TVALRLIVDRQNEIETFDPIEYWSITARLSSKTPPVFEAKLVEQHGQKIDIPNVTIARELVDRANQFDFVVHKVVKKERSRKPYPPFITSTLQQEASKKLRMSSNRTMRIAQQLYEGIELGSEGSVGLITYMRTDSPRVSPEFSQTARLFIEKTFGSRYSPAKPNVFQSKKLAQEAHEAIRPTSLEFTPEKVARFLDKAQRDLYELIWRRFLASQAAPALFDMTTVLIKCDDLMFRVNGSILKFDGFMKIYGGSQESEESDDSDDKNDNDRRLPPLEVGEILRLEKIIPRQSFTQPPAAFTEASLIKELEEQGIGRPSTYAETVSTIQKRKYVHLKDTKFKPTILGRIIAGLLVECFPRLVNPKFTAEMESLLDLIEEGEASWTQTLSEFYRPFQNSLKQAKSAMKSVKREGIITGETCPECGDRLLIRAGRFGLFLGCLSYPECQYTRKIVDDESEIKEPLISDKLCECGAPLVIRDSKTGPFLSCTRYPECKNTYPLTTGVVCPKCGEGELIERKTKSRRTFYSCSKYPKCDFSMWGKPQLFKCPNPECDSTVMQRSIGKKQGPSLLCPKCGKKIMEHVEEKASG
ncbi:MAG: type I DNA topoisomerase, partial [Desulfomonilaceae bacterium]